MSTTVPAGQHLQSDDALQSPVRWAASQAEVATVTMRAHAALCVIREELRGSRSAAACMAALHFRVVLEGT